MTPKKKLIEVALPVEAINKASAREKSIHHGHSSTLHLWWARRPLAAARAVIFDQMVDDPSAHPDLFPTEKAQEKERQRLFRIVEDLVLWENTTNETVLQQARDEIWQSWRYTCAENADHPLAKELFDRYKLPAFHDSFAGGGAGDISARSAAGARGDLRDALPNHPGGGVDPRKHRGRVDARVGQGQGPLPGHRAGVAGGDGDAGYALRGSGVVSSGRDGNAARATGRSKPNADGDASQTPGNLVSQSSLPSHFSPLTSHSSLDFSHLSYAPYLGYRPLKDGEPGIDSILEQPECQWIGRELDQKAQSYAIAHVVPGHLAEVKGPKLDLIAKTEAAVKDRVTGGITYWDHRAEGPKVQEAGGKPNAKLNSGEARERADILQGRLQKRLEDLKLEAQLSPLPPVVLGCSLVVPMGLLRAMTGQAAKVPTGPVDTQASAARARAIVMKIERSLGFDPTDRELEKLGYDIESRIPGTGRLRFIEVGGRVSGAPTITVTRNEILYSLNKPEDFILAIVEFLGDDAQTAYYLRQPFNREPDFGVTSVNYDFSELIARSGIPA